MPIRVKKIVPLPAMGAPLDAKRLALLSSIPLIHSGEALLFDHACANNDAVVFTGDKRCILALAAAPGAAEIVKVLQGRVVHFDCVTESMCLIFGWKNVRAKNCSDVPADEGLASALDLAHHESTAKEKLSARITALFGDSSGLLKLDF